MVCDVFHTSDICDLLATSDDPILWIIELEDNLLLWLPHWSTKMPHRIALSVMVSVGLCIIWWISLCNEADSCCFCGLSLGNWQHWYATFDSCILSPPVDVVEMNNHWFVLLYFLWFYHSNKRNSTEVTEKWKKIYCCYIYFKTYF